jgi:iron complex outermembrane receptor protein
VTVLVPCGLSAQDEAPFAQEDADVLTELSLEELMDVQVVTSVAGVAQPWFTTPSAIHVITAEEVRRAGHRTIAEALRMVPGIDVRQGMSHQWSVTSRGFNGPYANKLLVLIDGRTVYDPAFAGVFWDIQDVLLEDLDRIEVIRGPGATLWGANAVNGVVNIITKTAKDTQGTYLTAGAGTYERGFGALRHGGQFGDDSHYRVWGKYADKDQLEGVTGQDLHDDWDLAHGGLRIDTEQGDGRQWTVSTDAYNSNRIGEFAPVPIPDQHLVYNNTISDGRAGGGNILLNLAQSPTSDNGWSIQGYYERANRVTIAGLQLERNTVDLDWKHRFTQGDSHKFVWGLGWRLHDDATEPGPYVGFVPADRQTNLFSAFIQDTITIAPDRLQLMLGCKFEHNDHTDFEWQPSARLWFTPDDQQVLWAAISRPVKTPSRLEDDLSLIGGYVDVGLAAGGPPAGVYAPLGITGNTDTDSEEVMAYELGYRRKIADRLTIDATVFYNDYAGIQSYSSLTYGAIDNLADAESYGAESVVTWNVVDNWRLTANHSYLYMVIDPDTARTNERATRNQVSLHSYLDIADDLEFNVSGYYAGPRTPPSLSKTEYFRLDAGLTWRPTENIELALVGQNLLDAGHHETRDPLFHVDGAEIPRAVYGQVTFRF